MVSGHNSTLDSGHSARPINTCTLIGHQLPILTAASHPPTHRHYCLQRVQPVIDAINATGGVPDLQFHLYPATGHGFFNGLTPSGRKLTMDIGRPMPAEEVVTTAFRRVTEFFAEYLLAA
jgi:dienelactone hydrolase